MDVMNAILKNNYTKILTSPSSFGQILKLPFEILKKN